MASSTPRHLVQGAATRARGPRAAPTSSSARPVPPTLTRSVHHRTAASTSSSAPPPRRASSSSSRRDAHALASRVKFDSAPPPPPPRASTSAQPSPVSKADPQPSPSLADDWYGHLEASLPADWDNARHPKWDERGSETYDAEPVLPQDVDGRYRAAAAAEGDSIRADRAHEWDAEDEWLEVLRHDAVLDAQRGDDERRVREASAATAPKVDQLPPVVPPAPPPVPPQAAVDSASPRQRTIEAREPTSNPFAVLRTTTPRRRTAPLRLEPVQRTDPSLVAPYLPSPLASTSHDPFPSPASDPLVTRHDWRLSSPLRRYLRRTPPPLFSRTETDTVSLGHNRLVGVGVDAARIAKFAQTRAEEQWGWKVRVPESERGKWPDADAYRKRCVPLSLPLYALEHVPVLTYSPSHRAQPRPPPRALESRRRAALPRVARAPGHPARAPRQGRHAHARARDVAHGREPRRRDGAARRRRGGEAAQGGLERSVGGGDGGGLGRRRSRSECGCRWSECGRGAAGRRVLRGRGRARADRGQGLEVRVRQARSRVSSCRSPCVTS